ncbi:hypothetical protein KM043_011000 [Ampulex compressa]|nr:hypothetical protein KM043_011000 [Ampulex compressa]
MRSNSHRRATGNALPVQRRITKDDQSPVSARQTRAGTPLQVRLTDSDDPLAPAINCDTACRAETAVAPTLPASFPRNSIYLAVNVTGCCFFPRTASSGDPQFRGQRSRRFDTPRCANGALSRVSALPPLLRPLAHHPGKFHSKYYRAWCYFVPRPKREECL